MTDRELMQQALEGLEAAYEGQIWLSHLPDLSTALRERLAQPEQEAQTATYTCGVCGVSMQMEQPEPDGLSWLKKDSNYFSQPQRKPLTDEAIWLEYQRFWPFHPAEEPTLAKDIVKFARAIEAKLKEKNNG